MNYKYEPTDKEILDYLESARPGFRAAAISKMPKPTTCLECKFFEPHSNYGRCNFPVGERIPPIFAWKGLSFDEPILNCVCFEKLEIAEDELNNSDEIPNEISV